MKRSSEAEDFQLKAMKRDVYVFEIKNLPPEILLMILRMLNLEDKKKVRHLDSWFEDKVTHLLPNIFCLYNIKTEINRDTCNEIATILNCAMSKPQSKKKELKLIFRRNHTPIMREMIVKYIHNIVSLELDIWEKGGIQTVQYLMEPGMKFDLLESLKVYNLWPAIFALISNHADKLKKLKIERFAKGDSLPILPVLDNLDIKVVGILEDLSFLNAVRSTVTKLDIDYERILLNSPQLINSEDSKIPRLEHLKISDPELYCLIIQNSNNLVSLKMPLLGEYIEYISEWPEFPKIRELDIVIYGEGELEGILLKCTESLEFLVLTDCSSDESDYFPLVLPKLTYLYLEDCSPHNQFLSCNQARLEFLFLSGCKESDDERDNESYDFPLVLPKLTDLYLKDISAPNKFLGCNHASLEFLFLDNVDPLPNLESGLKLEKVETVILKPGYGCKERKKEKTLYTDTDLENIAGFIPNAKIIVWKKENEVEIQNLVQSRHEKKKFNMDVFSLMLEMRKFFLPEN